MLSVLHSSLSDDQHIVGPPSIDILHRYSQPLSVQIRGMRRAVRETDDDVTVLEDEAVPEIDSQSGMQYILALPPTVPVDHTSDFSIDRSLSSFCCKSSLPVGLMLFARIESAHCSSSSSSGGGGQLAQHSEL